MTEPVNDPEYDKRMHELLYSNEGRVEQCERIIRLERICVGMITDYLFCADDRHRFCSELHKGKATAYKPDGTSILDRIGETYDGIKINRYLDQLKELEVPGA